MSETFDQRRKQEFDDLQNEIAGRSTGRQARFLSNESRDDPDSEKRRADERLFRDLLDLYLRDPEYRRLFEELGSKLSDAEVHADVVIAALQDQISALSSAIEDMERRAAKGPDGQPVFKMADGRVVDADGNELRPEIAAGIIWPNNAPTAEDYFEAKANRDSAQDDLNNWLAFRNDTLGDIRNRYEDRERPMEKSDLKDALEDIETTRPELTAIAAPTASEPANSADVSALSLPMKLN